jgi:hypothetical protein
VKLSRAYTKKQEITKITYYPTKITTTPKIELFTNSPVFSVKIRV